MDIPTTNPFRAFAAKLILAALDKHSEDFFEQDRIDNHKLWTIRLIIETTQDLELVDWTLKAMRSHTHPIGLPPTVTLLSIAGLGASVAQWELLMRDVIELGWHEWAKSIATKIGRKMTEEEVRRLGDNYLKGASESDDTEVALENIYFEVLGADAAEAFSEAVQKMKDKYISL